MNNNLISKHQSGFRPGDSTTNQLIDFVNEILKAFDDHSSLEVRSVFLDLAKAFDKVWHKGLIFKFKQNGIKGQICLQTIYLTENNVYYLTGVTLTIMAFSLVSLKAPYWVFFYF